MSQEVIDYPNVYQTVHDESSIERVREIIMDNPDLIYNNKVKDEGRLLCAYPYAQTDAYNRTVDRPTFYP